MISANGDYVITFNGEIYNFKELRNFLNKRINIEWESKSDTEVLLNLFIYFKENKYSNNYF